YDESRKGNESIYIFLIVVAFVYLVLAGQYESFLLPLAVILSLPIGLFGSFLFLKIMGLSNDVYAQTVLLSLVGPLGSQATLSVVLVVLVIPGLYYLFARISDGRKLLRDAVDEPLTEIPERHALPDALPEDTAG